MIMRSIQSFKPGLDSIDGSAILPGCWARPQTSHTLFCHAGWESSSMRLNLGVWYLIVFVWVRIVT